MGGMGAKGDDGVRSIQRNLIGQLNPIQPTNQPRFTLRTQYTYDARSTTLYGSSTVKSLGRAAGWYSGVPGEALPNPPNRGSVDYAGNKSVADSEFRPYNYGSIVESKVAPDGTVTTRKLWTMGRLTHELALVLPDGKTVLTTDDVSANGAIAMFVADQ